MADFHSFFAGIRKKLVREAEETTALSPEVRARADKTVRIPMDARTESLNAAVSAGILMYALRTSY